MPSDTDKQWDSKQAIRHSVGEAFNEVVPESDFRGAAWKSRVLSPVPPHFYGEQQWESRLKEMYKYLNGLKDDSGNRKYDVSFKHEDTGKTYGKELRVTRRLLRTKMDQPIAGAGV